MVENADKLRHIHTLRSQSGSYILKSVRRIFFKSIWKWCDDPDSITTRIQGDSTLFYEKLNEFFYNDPVQLSEEDDQLAFGLILLNQDAIVAQAKALV